MIRFSLESTAVGVDSRLPLALERRVATAPFNRHKEQLVILALAVATVGLSIIGGLGRPLSVTQQSHPLLLLMVSDSSHILAIADNRMPFLTFFVVAFVRSMIAVPISYLTGKYARALLTSSSETKQIVIPIPGIQVVDQIVWLGNKLLLMIYWIKLGLKKISGPIFIFLDKYIPSPVLLFLDAASLFIPMPGVPVLDVTGARGINWKIVTAWMAAVKALKIYLSYKVGFNVDLFGYALHHI